MDELRYQEVEGLIPYHDYPPPTRQVCKGSGQNPRALADRRPLWKDEFTQL